ncbi:MAG: CARDB domain-containing protein, partial [Gemmatimonadales bacterium]
RATAVIALGLGALLSSGCSDRTADSPMGPGLGPFQARVAAAIAAQERHTEALLNTPGVVGTAVGLLPTGEPAVKILVAGPDVQGLPRVLGGVPVTVQVTGLLMAFSDPTTKARPAPLGFSVGHPAITAGTIGARVVDQAGNVYILSNNHVLANGNDAAIGDPALQPGAFDGGTAADQIGTLAAFQAITFSSTANNTIDAAIALVQPSDLTNTTPEDGYGTPNAVVFGDANGDGLFDDKTALLGRAVQKFGRTTKLTKGQITGINATVNICYEAFIIWCVKSARFVDQLIIEPGGFSGGGDSGSLIVTDDENKNPVGLLFAGSQTQTITNRIDLVLARFGVTVDGGAPPPPPPPPTPVTDIAITGVSAPGSVTQGGSVDVTVTVRNVGTEDVAASFDVTLVDATDGGAAIGTQSVADLAAGASVTRTYSWSTTGVGTGAHTLTASHAFGDENAANDQASAVVTVNAPSVGMHVGDLDGWASSNGTSWSATVEITVHDANHAPLNGATVTGTWSGAGALNANTCTTGELGGNGTCIVLAPSVKRSRRSVSFTVGSVTMAGHTYQSGANHDPDGSSNGTSVTVSRP